MTQYEQVIDALQNNNGICTLGRLYEIVDFSEWKTKTPLASIRRIVQTHKDIIKVKPGLWGLKSHRNEFKHFFDENGIKQDETKNHSYYQGLIVEIGNLLNFDTFVPNQDKNRVFINKKLSDITTMDNIAEFTYPEIIRYAKTIDTIWFNARRFPSALFEVEHTTSFKNSLCKFMELIDFNVRMVIVSSQSRKRMFNDCITLNSFSEIKKRVEFMNYDQLSNYHAKCHELHMIDSILSRIR